jgi:hypothetical protein
MRRKTLLWKNVEFSQMFKNIENSLEHWITFTYIINSETTETKAAVCIVHHKEYFKLPTTFIKVFNLNILIFNVQLFIKFYTVCNKFCDVCVKGMPSLSQVNI